MDYLYEWQVLAVVMGSHDWFQVSASAMGIPGVAGSDMGCDRTLMHVSRRVSDANSQSMKAW